MATTEQTTTWEPARLIPVYGIRNAEEQERRAVSAFLAVLSAVDEFGHVIAGPLGAPKSKLETYTEVSFQLADGRACARMALSGRQEERSAGCV